MINKFNIIFYDQSNISKIFLSPYVELSILDENCVKIKQSLFAKSLLVKNCNFKHLLDLLQELKYGLIVEELNLRAKTIFKTNKGAKEFITLMATNFMLE